MALHIIILIYLYFIKQLVPNHCCLYTLPPQWCRQIITKSMTKQWAVWSLLICHQRIYSWDKTKGMNGDKRRKGLKRGTL